MYDFNVNLYGNMQVTVIADNKDEAERILKDTMESITVNDIREKISRTEDLEIKESKVNLNYKERKEREAER